MEEFGKVETKCKVKKFIILEDYNTKLWVVIYGNAAKYYFS